MVDGQVIVRKAKGLRPHAVGPLRRDGQRLHPRLGRQVRVARQPREPILQRPVRLVFREGGHGRYGLANDAWVFRGEQLGNRPGPRRRHLTLAATGHGIQNGQLRVDGHPVFSQGGGDQRFDRRVPGKLRQPLWQSIHFLAIRGCGVNQFTKPAGQRWGPIGMPPDDPPRRLAQHVMRGLKQRRNFPRRQVAAIHLVQRHQRRAACVGIGGFRAAPRCAGVGDFDHRVD